MSIQSEWLPASKDEPAELDLDYVNIKVQVIRDEATGEMQVRLATSFNTDWQEGRFEEWVEDVYEDDGGEFEELYPMLKELRETKSGNDWALLNAAICAIEQSNPGVIRG